MQINLVIPLANLQHVGRHQMGLPIWRQRDVKYPCFSLPLGFPTLAYMYAALQVPKSQIVVPRTCDDLSSPGQVHNTSHLAVMASHRLDGRDCWLLLLCTGLGRHGWRGGGLKHRRSMRVMLQGSLKQNELSAHRNPVLIKKSTSSLYMQELCNSIRDCGILVTRGRW